MWWLVFPGAALLFLLVILIRSSRERKMLSETCYTVYIKDLPEAFYDTELAFLSDLHGEDFGENGSALAETLLRDPPALVLAGGDMLTVKKGIPFDTHSLESILQALSGRIPVYYALGNHESRMREYPEDFPGWYGRFLSLTEKYGVILLDNASAYYEKDGQKLRISGVTLDRKYYKKGRTERMKVSDVDAAIGPSGDCPEIVMMHSPMYGKTLSAWGADLVLSGHFHGGTVRLPFLGGVMTPQFQFFSSYAKGEKHFGRTTEIISGGLGTHSIRIRFMNKPEIIRIRLMRDGRK